MPSASAFCLDQPLLRVSTSGGLRILGGVQSTGQRLGGVFSSAPRPPRNHQRNANHQHHNGKQRDADGEEITRGHMTARALSHSGNRRPLGGTLRGPATPYDHHDGWRMQHGRGGNYSFFGASRPIAATTNLPQPRESWVAKGTAHPIKRELRRDTTGTPVAALFIGAP